MPQNVLRSMRRLFVSLLLTVFSGGAGTFAQTPGIPATVTSSPGVPLPTFKSVEQLQWSVRPANSRPDFLKHLTLESFGYSAAPTGPGFEFPSRLTEGPFTSAQGLECPRCVIRPTTERTRYTLPPFGTQATLSPWDGRMQLFTGFGGINAVRADNVTIDLDSQGHYRRDSSFNDAWLAQGWAGGRIAVDRNRRLWLGGVGRYLENLGAGKKHWNSLGGSATFQFGR